MSAKSTVKQFGEIDSKKKGDDGTNGIITLSNKKKSFSSSPFSLSLIRFAGLNFYLVRGYITYCLLRRLKYVSFPFSFNL